MCVQNILYHTLKKNVYIYKLNQSTILFIFCLILITKHTHEGKKER